MSGRYTRRSFIATAGKAGALFALGGARASALADQTGAAATASPGTEPTGPYIGAARVFLDTLIEKGTDRFGKRSTPLFCLSMDPDTHSPARAPEKIDWDYMRQGEYLHRDYGYYYRSHLHGANMIYEQGTLRALYGLTDATGNKKYASAADDCLDFFLNNMVSEQTGIFGWGEHLFWNVFADHMIGGSFGVINRRKFFFGHELDRWTTIYDVTWQKSPEKTLAEIDAIYEYKIHDYDTFICNRHSDYYAGQMDDLLTFTKHTGLFAHAFAFAHAKTGDKKYLDWAEKMGDVFWNVRNTSTNLIPGCVQRDREAADIEGMALLSLFLMRAYQWSPAESLLEKALAYVQASEKYAMSNVKGHARRRLRTDGTRGDTRNEKIGLVEANIAKAAILAYSLTGDDASGRLARDIVESFEPDNVQESSVERSQVSNDLEALGRGLSVALDCYEVTGERVYLEKAKLVADHVISSSMKNGLFVSKIRFYPSNGGEPIGEGLVYDARTAPGWLALNLIRLQRHVDATQTGRFAKLAKLDAIYD